MVEAFGRRFCPNGNGQISVRREIRLGHGQIRPFLATEPGRRRAKDRPVLDVCRGAQHAKAEAAINFYISRLRNSNIIKIERYGTGEMGPEETVKHAAFSLAGQEFMASDSSFDHPFTFTPAISFFANCETQNEVDEQWEKLSAGGEKGSAAGSWTNMAFPGRSFPRY
jgi:predicted 3-demethylubiquinone-9 3-methyltransferase (glyoxalase superfamily)